VALGYQALYGSSTDLMIGTDNVAVGNYALYSNTTGFSNTANGSYALYSNTTGFSNTANGSYALYSNTTGFQNTANGVSALESNTTGYNNTANGYAALNFNTTGSDNTANGRSALYSNTTGSSNTANGVSALYSNTTGSNNTANGNSALLYNQTGSANTALGYYAGEGTSANSFSSSTMIGYGTGLALTTGSKNLLLGYQAGDAMTTGSNNIVLGYDIDALSNTANSQLNIGNIIFGSNIDGVGTTISTGNIGIGIAASTSRLTISGTTTIGNGTTNLRAGLQIGYGGLCVDNDGRCVASTTGRITGVQIQSGNSDLAEVYFSNTELVAGTIVTLTGGLSITEAKRTDKTPVLGVISTKPGFTLGFDDTSLNADEAPYPVALSGRVPVQLSTENGPIMKGDQLMLSSLTGVAMKATGTGATVGTALEDFDETRMYSETYVNQFSDDIAEDRYGDDVTESKRQKVMRELTNTNAQTAYLFDGTPVKVGQVVMFVHLGYRWVDDAMSTTLTSLINGSTTPTTTSDILQLGEGKGLLATVVEAVTKLWNKVTGIEEKITKLEAENAALLQRVEQIEAQSGKGDNSSSSGVDAPVLGGDNSVIPPAPVPEPPAEVVVPVEPTPTVTEPVVEPTPTPEVGVVPSNP
jgi:hypothetical protein